VIQASSRVAASPEPAQHWPDALQSRGTFRIVVMARWPAPGRCKRRLALSCGSAQRAAAIQARLTSHTLRVAAAAAAGAGQLHLAVDGLGPGALRRWQRALQRQDDWTLDGRLRLTMQGGGNLGCRMQRQLRQGFASGARQVVLIGTDLPGLECRDLITALSLLQRQRLVIGPATDGGYWLIGMNRAGFRRAGARLMSGIAWGGAEVLAQTLEQAEQLGIPAVQLRRQRDLDDQADLIAWMHPVGQHGSAVLSASWR
jgi:rSAM/selenodomain-associated transferase 1